MTDSEEEIMKNVLYLFIPKNLKRIEVEINDTAIVHCNFLGDGSIDYSVDLDFGNQSIYFCKEDSSERGWRSDPDYENLFESKFDLNNQKTIDKARKGLLKAIKDEMKTEMKRCARKTKTLRENLELIT